MTASDLAYGTAVSMGGPGGRRDKLGMPLVAASLLMTFGSFVVMAWVGFGFGLPFDEKWLTLPGTLWVAIEHGLWLWGIVLLTRRGLWKRVGPLGWTTRVAAAINLACMLGVAGCFVYVTLVDDRGIGPLLIALALTGGILVCRTMGIAGLGVALFRWARASGQRGAVHAVAGMLLWWGIVGLGFGVALLSVFIDRGGTLLDVLLTLSACAGMLGLMVSVAALQWLYMICPAMLDDGQTGAFPVELGSP